MATYYILSDAWFKGGLAMNSYRPVPVCYYDATKMCCRHSPCLPNCVVQVEAIFPTLESMLIGVPFVCSTPIGVTQESVAIRLSENTWSWEGDYCHLSYFEGKLEDNVTIIDWFEDCESPSQIENVCSHGQAGWCRMCGSKS
jgi:hypothetical protein